MSVINTNVKALAAQASMSQVDASLKNSMERLSTGLRINSAKDDAAGLAITNRMTSQIRGYAVAIRNSNDAISMAQTAEGALGQVNTMLQRMRELAVQSSNGAMSAPDRSSLQLEVEQLKSQIQSVATTTNHNNIKLLDGSAGKVQIQTGVNAGDVMTMGFDSVQTKDIGQGSRASLSSVGGKLDTVADKNTALKDGDLVLNGVAVGASLSTSDKVSYETTAGDAATSAIAKAAAINAVGGTSGVYATVDKTVVFGGMMSNAASASGTITINGVKTAAISTSATNTELNRSAVEQAINAISEQTGVKAVNSHNDSQGVTLVAADGRNITIATDAALTTSVTGLAMSGATAETHVGSYQLNTRDGSAITIGSTVAQSQQGELHAGLAFGTYQADVAQVVTVNRTSSASAPATNAGAGMLKGNTLVINGVGIDAAVGSDDLSSNEDATNAPASTKESSGIAIAAAINKKTTLTGVSATAQPNLIQGTGFTAGAVTAIYLNGKTINTSLNTSSTRDDVLNVINAAQGQTGVVASAYGSGIQLTAADGRNVSIGVTGAGGAAALGLQGVTVGTVTAAQTYYSQVTLSSDKEFTLNSGSEGNNTAGADNNFALLGFQKGTFGGSDNGIKVAAVDISTQDGASAAITAIDSAIETVSAIQAKAGAFQNRLDDVVSNLTESNQNMSASRSRIQDTDYATETTNLARSQIISQAATAMLAQANQSSQSVLSLLK
jgi:flagellin